MIILLCEGGSERDLIEKGLDEKAFRFTRDDVLDGRAFAAKQISPEIHSLLVMLPRDEPLFFYRIGDTLHDELDLQGFLDRPCQVLKYCTKPEIEMLFIIHEGLYDQYQRQGSSIKRKPKEFAKKFIKDFDFDDELEKLDFSKDLLMYKKKHKNSKKDEGYLADLLK
jgi:hypothetical protein